MAAVTGASATSADQWGTPAWLADIAREVLGGIDLDPCSTARDNGVVKAEWYYTEEDDGLLQSWYTGYEGLELNETPSVLCNPPSGKSRLVKAFWARAVAHSGPVFWVGFNLGQLRYLSPSPLNQGVWGVLKKRVSFRDPEGRGRTQGRYDNYVCLTGEGVTADMSDRFHDSVVPLCSASRVWL